MRERLIERHLVGRIKKLGGVAFKMDASIYSGIPDRLVILDGVFTLVELKATGEKPRPAQLAFHRRLAKTGVVVLIIDSKEEIDELWPKPEK